MEQIRNRYFQYICSVLNPLIFKAFCLFLIGMEQMCIRDSIDAGHRCHKEGGPDGCPLWDRPKAQAEEPAPKTDAKPPRRTRKKREE